MVLSVRCCSRALCKLCTPFAAPALAPAVQLIIWIPGIVILLAIHDSTS